MEALKKQVKALELKEVALDTQKEFTKFMMDLWTTLKMPAMSYRVIREVLNITKHEKGAISLVWKSLDAAKTALKELTAIVGPKSQVKPKHLHDFFNTTEVHKACCGTKAGKLVRAFTGSKGYRKFVKNTRGVAIAWIVVVYNGEQPLLQVRIHESYDYMTPEQLSNTGFATYRPDMTKDEIWKMGAEEMERFYMEEDPNETDQEYRDFIVGLAKDALKIFRDQACDGCGKPSEECKFCVCKAERYCSRECQIKMRPTHKEQCEHYMVRMKMIVDLSKGLTRKGTLGGHA